MTRYIALLRGVNISGKNKVPMAELRSCFADLGYADVSTHLNSGNVIFSAAEDGETALADSIRTVIRGRLGLDVPVFVIPQEKLQELLGKAPDWWGTDDKAVYDNLIFVMPPASAEAIAEKAGSPSEGLEQVSICEDSIFWSFDRRNYARANWWKKTAGAGIGELITIRTANTLRRLAAM